jgi:hypothetical protein
MERKLNSVRTFFIALLSLIIFPGSTGKADVLPFQVQQVFPMGKDLKSRIIGELVFLGGIAISSQNKHLGGLSDLHVSNDGRMVAITDKGKWVTARLQHNSQGRLAGLTEGQILPILTTKGKKLKGKKKSDAEGLTPVADGYLVSFERKHRIWRYLGDDPSLSSAKKVTPPPGLKEMPDNGGLESLVMLANGWLLTFSEDLETDQGQTQGWLRTGTGWQSISLARSEDFAPTGMTRLASGDVLVLERSYSLLKGPAARVRLLKRTSIKPGAVLKGREIARLSGDQTVDNMEGISAVMTPQGERIYLMSDDNFNPLQRNLLFMFRFDRP